jgi:hypothetical protein
MLSSDKASDRIPRVPPFAVVPRGLERSQGRVNAKRAKDDEAPSKRLSAA